MTALPEKALERALACDAIVEFGPLLWGHRYHRDKGFDGKYVLIDREAAPEPGLEVAHPEDASRVIPRHGAVAFVSWWALGRAPRFMREMISGLVQHADMYAIAFEETVQGLDNVQAFLQWRKKFGSRVRWQEEPLTVSGRLLLGAR